MVAIFGILATLFTPENADRVTSAIYPAIGVIIGAIVGFGFIYLVMLVLAPYKQRNEARYMLSVIPSKRKSIADRLAVYLVEGVNLRQSFINESFDGDAVALSKEWATQVVQYFRANPDELGESRAFRFIPDLSDMVTLSIPNEYNLNEETYYAYVLLLTQQGYLKSLIGELLK